MHKFYLHLRRSALRRTVGGGFFLCMMSRVRTTVSKRTFFRAHHSEYILESALLLSGSVLHSCTRTIPSNNDRRCLPIRMYVLFLLVYRVILCRPAFVGLSCLAAGACGLHWSCHFQTYCLHASSATEEWGLICGHCSHQYSYSGCIFGACN